MPAESSAHGRAAEDAQDIYPFYLEQLAPRFDHDADAMANFKRQKREAGLAHGKKKRPEDKQTRKNKRKRADSNPEPSQSEDGGDGEQVEALMRKHVSSKRRAVPSTAAQTQHIVDLIRTDFPMVPAHHVGELVAEHDYSLSLAYLDLDRIISTWHEHPLKSWKLQFAPQDVPRPDPDLPINETALEVYSLPLDDATAALLREINEARTICRSRRPYKARSTTPTQDTKPAIDTIEDDMQLKDDETFECQCCFEEFAIASLVHCNGDVVHFVCKGCARRNAEMQIGLSRHALHCLSSDQCQGGFDESQRRLFLDEKLTKALDRIEWSASLLAAGIEGLATCPFCDYAAEYPPVDEAPVFQCEAPGCRKRSCRKCNKKDHQPERCEAEYTDADLAARRKIEEARTKALIRKCNKCKTPFIKDTGCNKMSCTKCGNQQCYLCSASLRDYSHFGKGSSQCTLWDENVQTRHDAAVEAAEIKARARVLAKTNGSISEDKLKINMAKAVQDDDERRRIRTQRHGHRHGQPLVDDDPFLLWAHVENAAAQAQPIQPARPAEAMNGAGPVVVRGGGLNAQMHQINALGWAGLAPPPAVDQADRANRGPRLGDIFDGLSVENPWQERQQRQQQAPAPAPVPAPAPAQAQVNIGHRPPRLRQPQRVPQEQQQPVQDEFLRYQQLVIAQRQLQQQRDRDRHRQQARPLFIPAPAPRLRLGQETDEERRAQARQQRHGAPGAEEQPAQQQPQQPNRRAPQAQDARFRNHLHGVARAVEIRFRGARGLFGRGQRQLAFGQPREANANERAQADMGGALEEDVRQARAADRAAGQNPFAVRAPEPAPESGNKRSRPN